MKAVIQRTHSAQVTVQGRTVGRIGAGLTIFLGIAAEDTAAQAEYLAAKIAALRIFEDDAGKMNRSILDAKGEALVISNFTLCADTKKSGNRPSFIQAARPEQALLLYRQFCQKLAEAGVSRVETGEFGADMRVLVENDGPVTICLERGLT